MQYIINCLVCYYQNNYHINYALLYENVALLRHAVQSHTVSIEMPRIGTAAGYISFEWAEVTTGLIGTSYDSEWNPWIQIVSNRLLRS